MSDNEEIIKYNAEVAFSVVDSIYKVNTTILNIFKKAQKLKQIQQITDDAVN